MVAISCLSVFCMAQLSKAILATTKKLFLD